MHNNFLVKAVVRYFPQTVFYSSTGDLAIKIPSHIVKNFLFFLKKNSKYQYKLLVDISALDCFDKKSRFEIFYNILSVQKNSRIVVTTTVYENKFVPTITSIYSAADWYEREIWDMFGVFFENHPNLRRILTDYSFKGHPLRKDFPLTGYLEVSYQDFLRRVVHEKVKLSQEYRVFSLENPWIDLVNEK